MKRTVLAITLVLALCAGVLAPSGAAPVSAQSAHAHAAAFDKTRFVAHLAAAYFAFHHFVWKPYKDGKLHGFHLLTYAKAALALLFAYHEVKKSYEIAKTSDSKTLQLLLAPMNKLATGFDTLSNKVKSHHFSDSDMNGVNGLVNGFQTQATKAGFGFKDAQSISGCC